MKYPKEFQLKSLNNHNLQIATFFAESVPGSGHLFQVQRHWRQFRRRREDKEVDLLLAIREKRPKFPKWNHCALLQY